MRFRLFGTIEALDRTGRVELGSVAEYRLLGILALHLGTVVRTDHLGPALESVSRRAVQNVVVRLRKALAHDDEASVLTVGGGYVLTAPPESVDLYRAVARLRRPEHATSPAEAEARLRHEGLFGGLATPQMRAMAEKKISVLLTVGHVPGF
ncbi:hypothetical protein ACFXPA_48335, partial [Amycolatopsis sp. NPDC059090]